MSVTDWIWRNFTRLDAMIGVQVTRCWRAWPELNAIMIVMAQYTPIVMIALLVVASSGLVLLAPLAHPVWTVGIAIAAAVLIRLLHEPVSRSTARPRPFDTGGFAPLLSHDGGESFPSNHAGGALALACGAAPLSGYHAILLSLAICLCIARIYCGLHHFSDVLTGALGGAIVGAVCVRLAGTLAFS